jgi:hypothetical protein
VYSCKAFLESFPINKIVLNKVNDQILETNKSNFAAKGPEGDIIQRVETLCNQTAEALLIANPDFRTFHKHNNPQLLELHQMVEWYQLLILCDCVNVYQMLIV